MENVIKFFKGLFNIVNTFIDNKGVVWIGGLGGFVYVLIFQPKNWFWGVVLGVLGCLFVVKNIDWIGKWFNKQYNDIAKKFK